MKAQDRVYWDLVHVMAWVAYRTDDAVRHADTIKESPSETSLVAYGAIKKPKNKDNLVLKAITEIESNLQAGKLTALAKTKLDKDFKSQQIPVNEWQNICIFLDREEGGYATPRGEFSNIIWNNISFHTADILKIWPPKKVKKQAIQSSENLNSNIMPKHRQWANAHFRDNLKTNRTEDEKAFRKQFPKDNRNILRELRKAFRANGRPSNK
jgi:hypothetical protein